jgi:hypothetical protein
MCGLKPRKSKTWSQLSFNEKSEFMKKAVEVDKLRALIKRILNIKLEKVGRERRISEVQGLVLKVSPRGRARTKKSKDLNVMRLRGRSLPRRKQDEPDGPQILRLRSRSLQRPKTQIIPRKIPVNVDESEQSQVNVKNM